MNNIHCKARYKVTGPQRTWGVQQRMGQAYFNAAYDIDPDWADKIRGTIGDPFHNDDAIAKFLEAWQEDHPEEK